MRRDRRPKTWPADAPMVPQRVRRLMQDRNYAEAVKAIDAAGGAKDAPKDYLAYLKGRALALQNHYDEAAAAFDAMQKDFPKSPWLRQSPVRQGRDAGPEGRFPRRRSRSSAPRPSICSPPIASSRSPTSIWSSPTHYSSRRKTTLKPDYAKAFEFYQKAIEAGPKSDRRIEVELRMAECQQN